MSTRLVCAGGGHNNHYPGPTPPTWLVPWRGRQQCRVGPNRPLREHRPESLSNIAPLTHSQTCLSCRALPMQTHSRVHACAETSPASVSCSEVSSGLRLWAGGGGGDVGRGWTTRLCELCAAHTSSPLVGPGACAKSVGRAHLCGCCWPQLVLLPCIDVLRHLILRDVWTR